MSRGKHKKHPVVQIPTTGNLSDEQVLDVVAGLPPEALPETEGQIFDRSHIFLECPFPGRPDMGDKDPEVMAWYRDNAPDEFARRYANRVIPVDLPEPSLESGPPTDFDEEEEPVKKPKVILE